MKKEGGDRFLGKLGKKGLRGGGGKGREWLIKKGDFRKDKGVLEVGCKMCRRGMEVGKRYGCKMEGVDVNGKGLEEGEKKVEGAKLSHLI
ncbi:hypothetical protein [Staphylococcus pettenkoferi]|uniref:hypothetical protein n=1 Tax=Staphylococcus pettenkoferi TaxID=170573 RepID=UPI0011A2DD7F|nr:hypothetical protein [Staphylococcus pettenkoferi]